MLIYASAPPLLAIKSWQEEGTCLVTLAQKDGARGSPIVGIMGDCAHSAAFLLASCKHMRPHFTKNAELKCLSLASNYERYIITIHNRTLAPHFLSPNQSQPDSSWPALATTCCIVVYTRQKNYFSLSSLFAHNWSNSGYWDHYWVNYMTGLFDCTLSFIKDSVIWMTLIPFALRKNRMDSKIL